MPQFSLDEARGEEQPRPGSQVGNPSSLCLVTEPCPGDSGAGRHRAEPDELLVHSRDAGLEPLARTWRIRGACVGYLRS